jgi:hypothetical protein
MPAPCHSELTSPLEGEVDRSLIGREGGIIPSGDPPSLPLPLKGGGESERLLSINPQSFERT